MYYGKIVARPDFYKLPMLALPIYVRSAGVYRVDEAWRSKGGENQTFVQVFWGVAGVGELSVGGQRFRFGAGDAAFKLSNERHGYLASSGRWELRWATFDGPGAQAFMESYGYPTLLKRAGACPHHLFDEIETGLQEMTPFRQRKLVSVMTEILALAGGADDDGSMRSRIVRRFIELAQTNYSNGSINVNGLADMIGVHRTTLARVFKERMKLSPGEYLARLRMQHALALLRESGESIAEVARAAGIDDPTYFCRCVRRATGLGPKEYRNARAAEHLP